MKSIQFPNMFTRNKTNIVVDYEATKQNLQALIKSEKGELFGDPYFGSNLRKFLYDQNDAILQDLLLDDLYSTIVLFMPQIRINRNDIKLTKGSKGELFVELSAINRVDYTTNLYSIVLLEAETE